MAITVREEIRDQFAHMIAAAIIVAPAILWLNVLSFVWIGFWLAVVREVTELKNPVTLAKIWLAIKNSKLDIAFWSIGAGTTAFFLGV